MKKKIIIGLTLGLMSFGHLAAAENYVGKSIPPDTILAKNFSSPSLGVPTIVGNYIADENIIVVFHQYDSDRATCTKKNNEVCSTKVIRLDNNLWIGGNKIIQK